MLGDSLESDLDVHRRIEEDLLGKGSVSFPGDFDVMKLLVEPEVFLEWVRNPLPVQAYLCIRWSRLDGNAKAREVILHNGRATDLGLGGGRRGELHDADGGDEKNSHHACGDGE